MSATDTAAKVDLAIKAKTPLVPDMDPHFTIEQTNQLSLDGLSVATDVPQFLGPDGEREVGELVGDEAELVLRALHEPAAEDPAVSDRDARVVRVPSAMQ